jgi:Holliday junction DNA helicase RuvA
VIAYIEGQVLLLEANAAVVRTQGVGYHVMLSKRDREQLLVNQSIALFIHTNVREDAFELYGFIHQQDKQIFYLLISITGVGPKLALSIISELRSYELINAVSHKDLAKLSSVPGVGKKTAERLCLELKDKILKLDLAHTPTATEPSAAISLSQAIRSLGYSKDQSDRAVAALEQDDLANLSLEVLIKKTLAYLTGTKSHDYN